MTPRRLFLLCALLLPQLALAAAQVFTIGVLPVHSARILTERYEPLRAYLEARLKQPVRVESASDFARFHARMLKGDFDLTLTASHLARLAQKDAGFQPLAQFTPDHDSLLMYAAERPLRSPKELQGKQLAVIDRLAVTAMAALSYLDEQGLEADRDFRVSEHRTHASVAHALISGVAAAAVTTSQGLLQIPDDLRRRLVVQKHIADIPAFVFLSRPDAPRAQAEALKTLLLAFPNDLEGIDFLGHTGYASILAVSEAHMRRTDAYLKLTRKTLAARP
ncbi:MAG: phosphate/phosphite/phosphonate ABC transporter substrate-binding protein [Betaproteobacteria bacterium]|nr:phosphate/phosphite/phosphonate ABC transporter substrate-binding protein [Betaproteobacteria bacterium]